VTDPRPDWRRLAELVDEDLIDDLLTLVTIDEIADAWLRHTRDSIRTDEVGRKRRKAAEVGDDPDGWAVDVQWSSGLPDGFRRSFVAALTRRSEPELLGYVGAGPMEDACWYDDETIAWFEQEAAASGSFRVAMRAMWVSEYPTAAFTRLEKAAGAPLPKPKTE